MHNVQSSVGCLSTIQILPVKYDRNVIILPGVGATLFSHIPMSTQLIKTLVWGISVAVIALRYTATQL